MNAVPHEIQSNLSLTDAMKVERHLMSISKELQKVITAATVADILEFDLSKETIEKYRMDSQFSRQDIFEMLQTCVRKAGKECRLALDLFDADR